ncbi:MAG TPA: DOPA 4,5-dioxygenase family protein [Candidatus Binatia bacterium]
MAAKRRKPKANDPAKIGKYHAHVYYDPDTRKTAAHVRKGLEKFNAVVGSWHDEPVGPHTKGMYQVEFSPKEFSAIVPWLMLNREGLDVLVHPSTNSGDGYGDHTVRSLWLGNRLEINKNAFEGRGS